MASRLLEVQGAKVPNRDGLRLMLKAACEHLPRPSHLWVEAGWQRRGKEWAEQELGLSIEVVPRTPKPILEKMAKMRAEECAKEGQEISWRKLLPHLGFKVLASRRVAESTFSWLGQTRRVKHLL